MRMHDVHSPKTRRQIPKIKTDGMAPKTQLNHSKVFDFAFTFSDVNAPENLDINVATDVTIIARMIILRSIFTPK